MLKKSTIVNVLLSMIALLSVSFIGITASQPTYDPWLDNTDDGYGGIDDIVSTAEHFGASGDPTKPCNITNWPKSTAETVWWDHDLINGAYASSPLYNANGFKYIHILVALGDLNTGEEVEVRVYSRIWNEAHTSSLPINCFEHSLIYPTNTYNIVIPVPSEEFSFTIDAASGTTCTAYLSFYMTW
ncbi:MAG: hypothetical protein JSV05_03440 [Candidatus Bathyarchaeota archaeon]|nr:MAG: hypothetical protein JSV05_03440 [Candidatus Bathyarchaeota archaeon]